LFTDVITTVCEKVANSICSLLRALTSTTRVHSPFTSCTRPCLRPVYTQVYMSRGRVRAVYTCTRPCTGHVHEHGLCTRSCTRPPYTYTYTVDTDTAILYSYNNKSSTVAEMGDRGHNGHGPKKRGCCAPFAGGAGSPPSTMWPGLRSTSVRTGAFIHLAVWP